MSHELRTPLVGILGFADIEIGKLAKVFMEESNTINDLKSKIALIFAPKVNCEGFESELNQVMQCLSDAPFMDDFETLKNLSKLARDEFGIGGAFGILGFVPTVNTTVFGRQETNLYEVEVSMGKKIKIFQTYYIHISGDFKNFFLDEVNRHEMQYIFKIGFGYNYYMLTSAPSKITVIGW
jgi:hypothetical protein